MCRLRGSTAQSHSANRPARRWEGAVRWANDDEYYLSTSSNQKSWCLYPDFHHLFYVIKLTSNENCTFGTIWLFGPCFRLYCLVMSFELNQFFIKIHFWNDFKTIFCFKKPNIGLKLM